MLNLNQAVELGLINSREYQSAREDLYLLSLPVTLQRFSFAAQPVAAELHDRRRTFGSVLPFEFIHSRRKRGASFSERRSYAADEAKRLHTM